MTSVWSRLGVVLRVLITLVLTMLAVVLLPSIAADGQPGYVYGGVSYSSASGAGGSGMVTVRKSPAIDAASSSLAATRVADSRAAAETAPVWDQMPLIIDTPEGLAMQADYPASLALRDQVLRGESVFKCGCATSRPASASQYFAGESPTNPGHAAQYGIPAKNLPFDWISARPPRPKPH